MQHHGRPESNWSVKKQSSCGNTALPLTASELKRWLDAVRQADVLIRRYGNWSAPPWIISKCGEAAVLQDLQERVGMPLAIRSAVYRCPKQRWTNVYYIIEVKKS